MTVTLPNLRKANYCKMWWENGKGSIRQKKPTSQTVNGQEVPDLFVLAGTPKYPATDDSPPEKMLDYARRKGLLDTWIPVCVVQFGNTHSLTYRGNEALKKFDAFKAVVFGGKK